MLKIKQIDKTFNPLTPNAVHGLSNIVLDIEEGSFTVIVGTNGSGKSTLLNAIAGTFLADFGTIELAGNNITRWPEHKRAKLIGRVFQNPFSGTAPGMTIEENLAMAVRRGQSHGFGIALTRELRDEFREKTRLLGMGLEDRLHDVIGNLSGGQRQALTLLMATWRRPALLLLDEHTAALDPKSAAQIINITNEIVTEKKLTTLMVTHSMHQAATLGDRLIMMHRGGIVHDLAGAEKKRVRPDDLLARFDDLRSSDRLDESAADLLRAVYA